MNSNVIETLFTFNKIQVKNWSPQWDHKERHEIHDVIFLTVCGDPDLLLHFHIQAADKNITVTSQHTDMLHVQQHVSSYDTDQLLMLAGGCEQQHQQPTEIY